MPTEQEVAAEGTRISNLMKVHTKPDLAAVYGIISEQKGVLIGSGTFLRLCGRTYLLTAEHVVDEGRKYEAIAHTSSSGSKPEPFKYGFRVAKPPIDLAIGRVDDEVVRDHGIVPLGVDALGTSAGTIERDFLFVHGYPEGKSKWVPIVNGGIHSTSTPFWTSDGVSDWDQFDSDTHIALMYPKDGWLDEKWKGVSATEPFGMSGSAVWQTNRRHTPGPEWGTDHSKLVGLIHLWNSPAEVLVATRIEVIREFMLDAVRHEEASSLWEERGRPFGDDLRDWYEAERRIPDLW